MAPSTSPASPDADASAKRTVGNSEEGSARRAEDAFALPSLSRFYRWNAPLYDWTRPFILFGRGEAVRRLGVQRGDDVLDVGCGTGWSFSRLLGAGGRVTGIEPSAAMRRQAARRVRHLAGADRLSLCDVPFGSDDRHRGAADRVLFSYSLSMIPPAEQVLLAARDALRPGGTIAVVDFLSAAPVFREWLAASHVHLGPRRIELLRELFTEQSCLVRSAGGWRYFVFLGSV